MHARGLHVGQVDPPAFVGASGRSASTHPTHATTARLRRFRVDPDCHTWDQVDWLVGMPSLGRWVGGPRRWLLGRVSPGHDMTTNTHHRTNEHDATTLTEAELEASSSAKDEPWGSSRMSFDAGHHDPGQRPTPPSPARPARRLTTRLDAGRYRGRGGAIARDHREPCPRPVSGRAPVRAWSRRRRPG